MPDRLDFHTSNAFHTPPSFPYILFNSPNTPPISGLPDQLLEIAALTSPTSPLQLSLDAIPCFNVFYLLHRLGLAVSPHWLPRIDRVVLSNLLYEVEFAILGVPDYSRVFLDVDNEVTRAQIEPHIVNDGASRNHADAASLVEALMSACQIFVFGALRELPRTAKIFAILLDRLRRALDRPGVRAMDIWRREGNANLLVWAYILGYSVCAGAARGWWVRGLVVCMLELEVRTREELQVVLKHVAWVDGYFDGVVGEIWEEIVEVRRGLLMDRELDCVVPGSVMINEACGLYGIGNGEAGVAVWYV